MDPEKKIRDNIRAVLKSKHLTHQALCAKMDYSPVTFSQLLSGKFPLSEKHIRMIAKAADVDRAVFYKDVWPAKTTQISRRLLRNKSLDKGMEELADYLEHLDPQEANEVLRGILNLVETLKPSK